MFDENSFSLKGKIALVTGASYGIGFAIATGFAKYGATIVFNDINQELVELDHPALFVKLCDMYANSLDAPKPGQAERMKRNLEYLLTYRDDLTDKERRLIKSFPLMSEYNLDHNEFEDGLDDEDYFKDGFLYASRKMPKNKIKEQR